MFGKLCTHVHITACFVLCIWSCFVMLVESGVSLEELSLEARINLLGSKYNSWPSVNSLLRTPGNSYQKFQVQNKLLRFGSQTAQQWVFSCPKC